MCRQQKVAVRVPIPVHLTNAAKARNNRTRTNPHQTANLDHVLSHKVLRAVNPHHEIRVTGRDLVRYVRVHIHVQYHLPNHHREIRHVRNLGHVLDHDHLQFIRGLITHHLDRDRNQ